MSYSLEPRAGGPAYAEGKVVRDKLVASLGVKAPVLCLNNILSL